MFARGHVPISEVLSELRAEETRLHCVGLLQVPFVLAARAATPPVFSRSSAPSLLPTPAGSESRSRSHTHCGYCSRDGHPESDCFKKKRDMRNKECSSSSGTRASSLTSSTLYLTEQDIVELKLLLAASDSSTGTAGFVTRASSVKRPPSTQLGTSTWVLDSGASFHMSSDSSVLSSLRPLDHPINVLTADGTPLPVASRGTLSTSSFYVPYVSHVPCLTMNLFSASQLIDCGCRVILDVDSCTVQDRHTKALVGAGPRRLDSQGLWELD